MKSDPRRLLGVALLALVAVALPMSVPHAMFSFLLERGLTMWIAASSGIAIIAGCVGLGLLVLPRDLLKRDLPLAFLFALGTGTGIFSCIVLKLGLLPSAVPTGKVGWIVVLVAVAAGLLRIYPVLRARLSNGASLCDVCETTSERIGYLVAIFLAAAVALVVVTAFAPPLLFDVTEYHLGAWRDNAVSLKNSSDGLALHFNPIPHNFYARFPFPIESLYWLGLLLAQSQDFAPKIINGVFVLGCALLVFRMLRGVVSSRTLPMLGMLLVLTHPVMRDVTLDAFIDAPVAFLVAASVYASLVLPIGEIYVATLLFGTALASKYTVAQIYLAPFLLLILTRWKEFVAPGRGSTKLLVGSAFALVVVPLFWFGKNLLLYSNPLEPFFVWLFRSGDSAAIAREKFYIASHYPQPFWTLGYWTSLLPRLKEFGWILLPLAVAAPVLSGKTPNTEAKLASIRTLLFIVISYALWNLVRESQNRFLLPDILLLICLSLATLQYFSSRCLRNAAVILLLCFSAIQLSHQAYTLISSGEFKYLAELSLSADQSKDPREKFYRDNLGALGEILPAANSLPASSRILLVYEARPYLFARPIVYNTVWDDSEILRLAGDATSTGTISERLRKAGITHILVNRQELRRYIQQYATDDQLRTLGISPRSDRALAFHATQSPEDLFPPFYRSPAWKNVRAEMIEYFIQLRKSATAVAGTAPTEIYLAPLP